jgi:hypothetical protein
LSWNFEDALGIKMASISYGAVDNFVIEATVQISTALIIGYFIKKLRII